MIKFLKSQGFVLTRVDGSHHRFVHPDGRATTVAFHNRPLKKGTLKAILNQVQFSLEEFLKLK